MMPKSNFFKSYLNYILQNTPTLDSKFEQSKYKSLTIICSISSLLSLIYLFVGVFILKEVTQSIMMVIFVIAGILPIILIRKKGWLIVPSLIAIGFGYLIM